jgi:hypothetical protein
MSRLTPAATIKRKGRPDERPFQFQQTPGQAGFGSTAGAAGFLALAAIFVRLM